MGRETALTPLNPPVVVVPLMVPWGTGAVLGPVIGEPALVTLFTLRQKLSVNGVPSIPAVIAW